MEPFPKSVKMQLRWRPKRDLEEAKQKPTLRRGGRGKVRGAQKSRGTNSNNDHGKLFSSKTLKEMSIDLERGEQSRRLGWPTPKGRKTEREGGEGRGLVIERSGLPPSTKEARTILQGLRENRWAKSYR